MTIQEQARDTIECKGIIESPAKSAAGFQELRDIIDGEATDIMPAHRQIIKNEMLIEYLGTEIPIKKAMFTVNNLRITATRGIAKEILPGDSFEFGWEIINKLITAAGCGLSPLTDHEVFLMFCYEDDTRCAWINPELISEPKNGVIHLELGKYPEDLSPEYLRPEQKELFKKYLPEVYARFEKKRKITMSEPMVNEDFCWGQYMSTLEGVSRIRLGRHIIREFKEYKVDVLWRYISPSYPAIVLCPESCRDAYIKDAKIHFSPEMDPEIAYRKYIGTGRSARYDKQGRVYLPVFCLEHAEIKLEEEVAIIGAGLWYEIWAPENWEKYAL